MTQRKSKQPVQRLEDIELYRRYYSDKERESMDAEDFAGPGRSFPIKTQQDVHNAARLIGHADDPEAVKAKIKAIAKKKGFSLPKAWQDEEDAKNSSDRSATPDNKAPDDPLDILADADDEDAHEDDHAIMDTAEGVDEGNDDEDCDEGEDGDDMRGQDEATIVRADLPTDILYYAPITRINKKKREVIGVATAEVKDHYGTVIGYEASKDAFARWRGNIREMHDSKKAVGHALEITPDDEKRQIVVRALISKGAQDTWEKVLDGTLTGFSIGGKNGRWTERLFNGEKLPYLERYDQAELSVVDNPGCPGADITLVRADGMASDILAKDDELNPKPSEAAQPPTTSSADSIDRAGARLSKDTMDAMHDMRNHQLMGAMKTMKTCGCNECMAALKALDPDDDGDIDLDGIYDPDDDADMVMAGRANIATLTREINKHVASTVQATLAPVIQRVNALLASDAQRSEAPDVTRRVDDLSSDITAIKDLVEKIAAQPVDGGPVLHGGPGTPMDKRLALQGSDHRSVDDAEILRRALEYGFTPPASQEAQVLAASKLVRR